MSKKSKNTWKDKLNPNKLYHLSETKINKLYRINFIDEKGHVNVPFNAPAISRKKPVGFWYSVGAHWLELGVSNCCYLYEVIPDPNIKILKLDTPEKVEEFIAQYYPNRLISFVKDNILGGETIAKYNWKEISKNYDGIEFSPYFNKINDVFIFELYPKEQMYQTIDIPSGVLWNPKKTKLKLVKTFKIRQPHDTLS